MTKQLGLDKPLPVQYAVYMQETLRGDLGTSISTKRPITEELAGRVPATLELLFSGMFIAILLGVPLGVLSARWQGKPFDWMVRVISIVGRFDARLFSRTCFTDRLFPQPGFTSAGGQGG